MLWISTEQKYKQNTFVFAPIFHELKLKDLKLFLYTQKKKSVSGGTTICLTSPSHGVDQVVDCGLWNVGPLLFNGCAKLLDIGRNWSMLSYTYCICVVSRASQTCSMGDMSGEYAEHAIKGHSKMFSFITQHNATDVSSFEGTCSWHADCRNVHQRCCPWIECSFFYHKPSPKAFQTIWQYIQLASQLQTMCCEAVWMYTPAQDLHIQHVPLQDRLRPATQTAAATIRLNNQRMPHSVCGILWVSLLLMSQCGSSGPWWRWGYGMGRHMLWTTNTGGFYWWHFECTEILWCDPEAHCCAIHPRPSPHVAAW